MPVLNLCQQAPPSCTQRTPNLALSSCSSRKTLLGPLGVVEVFPVFAETLRVFVVIPDTQKMHSFQRLAFLSATNRLQKTSDRPCVVIRYPPPLLIPGPQLAAPPTAKIAVAVVIRQTCQNRYFSFFDQYAIAAQRTLVPFRLHTHLETTSVVPTSLFFPLDGKVCVHIRGEGPNHVSLSLEGVGNTSGSPNLLEIPNVDTLLGAVDTTMSSWTVKPKLVQITIKLCFPTPELLDAFLFALSYVRLSDFIEPRSPSTIPLTERRLTHQDVQRFSEMRVSVYRLQATIAVLPVELLSEIFSLLPSSGRHSPLLPSGHRRSAFASTLLPLWVCSEWRSVAVGTATLWRTPPTFTLLPSFFRRGGGAQAVLWLNRAKGCNVALSIKSPTGSRGLVDLLRSQPPPSIQPSESPFTAVQSLDLTCHPSQLVGSIGALFHSLKLLRLDILPHSGRRPEPSYIFTLFRSAPLLRDASITADSWHLYRRHSFVALLPWAQLTALSMQVTLEFSAWVHIFTQCTSLETGRFALFNEEASPPCPLGILTLAHLASLRLEFCHVRDTRFFNHLALPRLGNLHVEGTLVDAANISFVANYPALRDLTVHLDLFDNGLQNLIRRFTPPERSGPIAITDFQVAGVPRLRSFTILTFTLTRTHKFADNFIETSAPWIVKRVLAGCEFKLCGEVTLLDRFRRALATTAPLETSPTIAISQSRGDATPLRGTVASPSLRSWTCASYLHPLVVQSHASPQYPVSGLPFISSRHHIAFNSRHALVFNYIAIPPLLPSKLYVNYRPESSTATSRLLIALVSELSHQLSKYATANSSDVTNAAYKSEKIPRVATSKDLRSTLDLQTLFDSDYNILRTTAINVIRPLGRRRRVQYTIESIPGEGASVPFLCFGLEHDRQPSALSAAKLGLGILINEIKNSATKAGARTTLYRTPQINIAGELELVPEELSNRIMFTLDNLPPAHFEDKLDERRAQFNGDYAMAGKLSAD
ncbi:hypothetical protein C8R46DRAFT_1205391 [Mycena filopes]|nr:hypothetical protein C8R46DRAFT_1205391 [Mycena filopes]